jgi:hypothetical protein
VYSRPGSVQLDWTMAGFLNLHFGQFYGALPVKPSAAAL